MNNNVDHYDNIDDKDTCDCSYADNCCLNKGESRVNSIATPPIANDDAISASDNNIVELE